MPHGVGPRSSTLTCIKTWYRASRPFTLPASVVPVLVGSALAFQEGRASLHLFFLVLVASLLVQIATNLVDEYADHARPGAKRKHSAPYKVISLGLLSAGAVKRGAVVCFGVATAIGLYLVFIASWPILVISLASLAVAYAYAAGPYPLGSLGIGQVLVFIFMGPVMVMGAYYVHTQAVTLEGLVVSIPVACIVTAILVANDLRDVEEDRASGKVTPVTLMGRNRAVWFWLSLVLVAYVVVAGLAVVGDLSLAPLLAFLSLPMSARAFRSLWHQEERVLLARGLRYSATQHMWFGVLLALGVAVGRFY